MIKALTFNSGNPFSLHFLIRYSKVAQVDKTRHNMFKYVMELSTVAYEFTHVPPSKVAAVSLALSMMALEQDAKATLQYLWTPTIEHYSLYTLNSIRSLIQDLARLLMKISRGNQAAKIMDVRKKYSDKRFLMLSTTPQ